MIQQTNKQVNKPSAISPLYQALCRQWATQKKFYILTVLLMLLSVLLILTAISVGTYDISLVDVFNALRGKAANNINIMVVDWRLPRALAAIFFGMALGVSGLIFQSLLRNPLASPDVIGFNTGAYTGVLLVLVLFDASYSQITLGAVCGGIVSAIVIFLLAKSSQAFSIFRLIIVGIAVNFFLSAINIWLTINAALEKVIVATLWNVGSLNGISWAKVIPTIVIIMVAFALVALMSTHLNILALGDKKARSLGINANKSKFILFFLGIFLTSVVTAVAGPISFLSLAAPQIAKLLLGRYSLILSALMGGVLLAVSDILSVVLLSASLPVGSITVIIGGVYLLILLLWQNRSKN